MVKASSTDTSRVSRRKPLACSTMTRLASAARSWGMTVDGVGACSCRIATQALWGGYKVGDGDWLAAAAALEAGTVVGLQLEQFQFAGLLGGGSEQAQAV